MKKIIQILIVYFFLSGNVWGQTSSESAKEDKQPVYKKRVLESVEVDLLSSYYTQDGDNAAVSGGIGTEDLQDATATIIVSIPINEDDVLVIDAGVSAYTSASSSNVNPFDSRRKEADAFVASSGESISDVWSSANLSYSHNSDDRNKIISGNLSFAKEYDYTSLGLGGAYTLLSNQKNTEFTFKGAAFFDKWGLIYPAELRPFGLPNEEDDDDHKIDKHDDDGEYFNIDLFTIHGNTNYAPRAIPLETSNRNSYAVGLGFSQILSKNIQGTIALDVVMQKGNLSTPFQRVYFKDVENSFIENFHLADDIERLPSSRLKAAIGGRLHYYVNENISLRTFYRYYQDDWKLKSHTASIEAPIKILLGHLTFYPSYRFYYQSAIEHFAPYDEHLSTDKYYTSDYDLSKYYAHQYGFGIGYNNMYGSKKLGFLDFSSIDIKYYRYHRDSSFNSHFVTLGVKFKLY